MKSESRKPGKPKFVLNEKSEAKICAFFDELAKTDTVKSENQAYAMILKYIMEIDNATRKGSPLSSLYGQINKISGGLGISDHTFAQYVRKARKESGSLLYRPREARKRRSRPDTRIENAESTQIAILGRILDFAWRLLDLESESGKAVDEYLLHCAEGAIGESDKAAFADILRCIREKKPLGSD